MNLNEFATAPQVRVITALGYKINEIKEKYDEIVEEERYGDLDLECILLLNQAEALLDNLEEIIKVYG